MCISLCSAMACAQQEQPEHDDSAHKGVHNVLVFHEDESRTVISGSLPEGVDGFDALDSMGVTTVISVDAAMPQLDLIEERGMRSIHIPIKYSAITDEQRAALALALKESEGVIYVHCHHGKHRGPAAAAIGLVGIGACDADAATGLMEKAGTSEVYEGLWRDVGEAKALTQEQMHMARPMLVEKAEIKGIAPTMAEIDRVFEHLEVLSENGWQAPADHPDLSAISEAGQLTDLFRQIISEPHPTVTEPIEIVEYQIKLDVRYSETLQTAQEFEDALEVDDHFLAQIKLNEIRNHCNDCHAVYR